MIMKNLPQKSVGADSTLQPKFRFGTPREACVYGRFSHTKLYDYINEGKVDAYKRDKSTLIDLDSTACMRRCRRSSRRTSRRSSPNPLRGSTCRREMAAAGQRDGRAGS
jgi:hypothetical protein